MSDDAPLLLDVTRLVWRRWKGRLPTGIDRVALAYLDHFGSTAQAVVQHDRFRRILGRRASEDLFALLKAPAHFKTSVVRGLLRNLAGLKGKGQNRLYLNVGHTGLNSPGFVKWVQAAGVKPVYLVHDLIPIKAPQFARSGEAGRHRERIRAVLLTGSGIITNSGATLDELARFAASEALKMPPSLVAWLGVDPLPAVPASSRPARPTFVTLGTIEARKNHSLLLDVWSRLISRLGDKAPMLLVIGQRGWEADETFRRLDHDERLRGHVVEVPRCSDAELASILWTARALLFPTFAEGYGLPLVEALSVGLPAIASDLPALREIGGDIPTYLDPGDEGSWEKAVLDYAAHDSVERAAQQQRMTEFRAPSWVAHFQKVEKWLKTLP